MLQHHAVDRIKVTTVDPYPGLTAPALASEPTWEPRVLVVDDDEVSRLAAVGLLRSLGFAVDAAADGREAVEVSARWPYVAIFMDCEMPEVDGYTATRQLRARDGKNAQTPVIALTSKPRWVSLASGMDQHLEKPLRLDTLQADCLRLGLLARDGAVPSPSTNVLALYTPLLDPSVFPVTAADRTRPAHRGATFTRQTTARLPELWRAINAGDGPSVKRLAHALRDRATTVGTQRVAVFCDLLGQTSVDGLTILAPEIEPQLRQVLSDTSAAIRAYVDDMPSPGGSNVQPADLSHADDAASKPVERVRVALADDDPLARIAISAMLERVGWLELVGNAAGVEEIVELAALTRPDVVVLDWMMPARGGRAAARRILDHNPATVIVALTSSYSLDALTEMTSAGASCLVAKGGSADQLIETIARALKASAAARAAEEGKRSGRPDISGGLGPHGPAVEYGPLEEAGVQRLWSDFGSSGVLADLVDLFGSEAPQQLNDIRCASEAGDTTAVSAHAHQLKGSCLTLAAVHMAEHCNQLELTASDRTLEDTTLLIDVIQSDFERAHAALLVIASPSAPMEADVPRDAVDARCIDDALPNRGFDVRA